MTRPCTVSHRSDGLCACGCGLPKRPNSKYNSEKCQQRKARLLAVAQGKNRREYRRAHPPKVKTNRLTIKIIDPECCDPYYVSKAEYSMFASDYSRLGCTVEMNGQVVML